MSLGRPLLMPGAICKGRDELKAHSENFLPPWVIQEMKTMNRNTAYFEAHVDEVVNTILHCVFPAEARFSVAPQARQKEGLPMAA
ncbi:hypothetical protein BT96DRAFT_44535 [Gymnopus androsaceus JB14]|uniref:Uncharacterized protein n=1 Tax=Gymnopus androsaceus JB14 TaxID=1447944 RepID=A0A6A4HLY9_9AGAR|nr:hypothetical protein BT96DRAFT_44535 [Gymnopus androsaceus JB14]